MLLKYEENKNAEINVLSSFYVGYYSLSYISLGGDKASGIEHFNEERCCKVLSGPYVEYYQYYNS